MRSFRKKNIVWLLLATPLFFTMVIVHVDAAETKVFVDPKLSNAGVGGEFTVKIRVTDVNDLTGFQFELFWNRTILNVTDSSYTVPAPSWTNPFWLPMSPGVPLNNTYNATHGRFLLGCLNTPVIPVSGNFVLATLTFKVLALVNCTLDLFDAGTILTDSEGNVIPHETIDGEFTTLLISSISISASPDAVTVGKNTTISGSITPARAGATVTIHYRLIDEAAWNTTTVISDSTGGYSCVWAPSKLGTYEVKASWPGDADTLGAESSIIEITVKAVAPYLLYAVIVVVIVIVVAIVIYFLKIRKP